MDITNVTESNTSADEYAHNKAADNEADVGEGASGSTESPADQLNEPITPIEEGRPLLDRVCEAVRLAGKELSEDERLHITNSTVSFSSNCRVHTSGRKPKSWELNYPA